MFVAKNFDLYSVYVTPNVIACLLTQLLLKQLTCFFVCFIMVFP
jgi:hypothetical protein